jgi:hypothetical protein
MKRIKFVPLKLTDADRQLLEIHRFSTEEILRIFGGVPAEVFKQIPKRYVRGEQLFAFFKGVLMKSRAGRMLLGRRVKGETYEAS